MVMNSQYKWDRGVWAAAVKDDKKDINKHLRKVRVIEVKLMEIAVTCSVFIWWVSKQGPW